MANFMEDNKDLQFYIKKGIDWPAIAKVNERDFKLPEGFQDSNEAVSFYKEILNLIGQFASEQIAPRGRDIDQEKAKFKDGEVELSPALNEIMRGLDNLQLHGMCLPRELGGQNVPLIVYMLSSELMSRGDVSTMAHFAFHGGIAMALLAYSLWEGSTEFSENGPVEIKNTRFLKAIQEIAAGEAWGSMDITEPDAGSDMARLRTKAEKDSEGVWRITGEKIFITSGHGKYHIVIARTTPINESDPFSGLKGLSIFLVKAYDMVDGKKEWYAKINGIEDKIGHHGSATVSISYNETVGELIGKPGEGFKYMLLLMNNARIAVGFESLGLSEAAYRMAKSYAEQRPSMGKMIANHEVIAEYLEEMRLDIIGVRALCITASFHEEMYQKLKAEMLSGRLSKSEMDLAKRRSEIHMKKSRSLTPLLKYQGSEKSVEIARKNLQIHGGVGYTKDYDAERLLRDSLAFPIYEGTSQIQALMATKDSLMDVINNPSEFAKLVAIARAASLTSRSQAKRRVANIQLTCYAAIRSLVTQIGIKKIKAISGLKPKQWIATLKDWDPKIDFSPALLHAERLTKIMIEKSILEILAAQADAHPEREELLYKYLDKAEPIVEFLSKLITKKRESNPQNNHKNHIDINDTAENML